MSRPLRIEYAGALYHVISRGNAGQPIFRADLDQEQFLGLLGRMCERFAWRCHAYCLMGNHFHLVLETPLRNLARGMQQLSGGYAQGFNRRHGLYGHLFHARYKAIVVERETHLLELARYVVLNPVRAGLCESAEAWPWSSYRSTAGKTPVPPFLHIEWLLAQFGGSPARARARYRSFVSDGDPATSDATVRARLYVGSNAFIRRVAPRVEETLEFPRAEREPFHASIGELFAAEEARALVSAYREHGYRLREIADYLGVHPSTVCRRLRRAETTLRCKV